MREHSTVSSRCMETDGKLPYLYIYVSGGVDGKRSSGKLSDGFKWEFTRCCGCPASSAQVNGSNLGQEGCYVLPTWSGIASGWLQFGCGMAQDGSKITPGIEVPNPHSKHNRELE